jgi:hypothetical protein
MSSSGDRQDRLCPKLVKALRAGNARFGLVSGRTGTGCRTGVPLISPFALGAGLPKQRAVHRAHSGGGGDGITQHAGTSSHHARPHHGPSDDRRRPPLGSPGSLANSFRKSSPRVGLRYLAEATRAARRGEVLLPWQLGACAQVTAANPQRRVHGEARADTTRVRSPRQLVLASASAPVFGMPPLVHYGDD